MKYTDTRFVQTEITGLLLGNVVDDPCAFVFSTLVYLRMTRNIEKQGNSESSQQANKQAKCIIIIRTNKPNVLPLLAPLSSLPSPLSSLPFALS